jgi:hypothetical protein
MSDFQMTIFAPAGFCTDRRWDLFCNVVVVVLSPGDAPTRDFKYLVDGMWPKRMNVIPDRLQKTLDGGRVLPLAVRLSSDVLDFHPLISKPVGRRASMDFDFRDDSPVLKEVPPRSCHVVLLSDGSGVAMFVARAKLTRKYVLEGDKVLRSDRPDSHERYHELLGLAHAALQPTWGLPRVVEARCELGALVLAATTFPTTLEDDETHSLTTASTPPFRRIFASYAREDKAVVECVDSVMRVVHAGELLWDLKLLRSGDLWQERVFDEIERAESFQLFWSAYSHASVNVEKEWRHAMSLERDGFVRPVFWSEPMPEPPEALQHLHFARIHLPEQSQLTVSRRRIAAILRQLYSWLVSPSGR